MDIKELKELMSSFNTSNISELEVDDGQTHLLLKKNTQSAISPASASDAQADVPVASEQAPDCNAAVVRSPLVGVFYAASAPGEAPFVKEGQAVRKGDTICLVEAMKMMNEIMAPSDGIVKKILVENGEMVSYNQPLAELGV